MKFISRLTILTALILFFSCGASFAENPFYQYSTINSLLAGNYDGELSVAKLKTKGDFGLGTFNNLNGEMILLDGKVFRVGSKGKAEEVSNSDRVSFVNAVFFNTGSIIKLEKISSLKQLNKALCAALPSKNIFFAIRIDGMFETMRTRSIPSQKKPYQPLIKVVKDQSVFKFTNVEGTMVGIHCPPFIKGLGIPGFHWHFLTKDHDAGGHVLDCQFKGLVAKTSSFNNFLLQLPNDKTFLSSDLSEDKQNELKKVEK